VGVVVHAFNPRYAGGLGRRIAFKPAVSKENKKSLLEK
jgi:hypothetical protein